MNTVERRLELLIMEGNGFSRNETVKHLSQKYECSPHTLWRDFRTKCRWQPSLMEIERAFGERLTLRSIGVR